MTMNTEYFMVVNIMARNIFANDLRDIETRKIWFSTLVYLMVVLLATAAALTFWL